MTSEQLKHMDDLLKGFVNGPLRNKDDTILNKDDIIVFKSKGHEVARGTLDNTSIDNNTGVISIIMPRAVVMFPCDNIDFVVCKRSDNASEDYL